MHSYDDTPEERRKPTPMTRRVTALGAIAILMLSILGFRLWYLQVLSGDRYIAKANDNRIRDVREQGPRGDILDSDGNVLVANKLDMALEADLTALPSSEAKRRTEIAEVSKVAGLDVGTVRKTLAAAISTNAGGKVILTKELTPDQIYYLREHQESYPGIDVERTFTRTYKDGDLAAQLFGTPGQITAQELKESRYSGLQQGDIVGQSGLENEYDRYLRGRIGVTRIPVDALGQPTGEPQVTPARPGDNVRTTIDPSMEATGQSALDSFGLPGAFVAMDVHSGAVLAMGSAPTYDPSDFTRPFTQKQFNERYGKRAEYPLVNRAITGAYPTGSVFKPITAIAAMEGGLITPSDIVVDNGTLKVDVQTLHNAKDAVFGPLDMENALRVSSDIFFFRLGYKANPTNGSNGLIQDWAKKFGLGEDTGIDLPNEAPGLIPTPKWRNDLFAKHETDRPWTAGDNINLSVGQGDLQADPLQMADVYAAIANGGDLVQPHVVDRVENVSGQVVQEVQPHVRRHIDMDETYRETVMKGLTDAAMSPGGTSYPVFGNFPVPIAGKTGTAERAPNPDQAWYVAVAPADDPQIVVAVTIERGGFGADTAAPVAARIIADYLKIPLPAPEASGTPTLHE